MENSKRTSIFWFWQIAELFIELEEYERVIQGYKIVRQRTYGNEFSYEASYIVS
jgi:hypothetical protein